MTKIKYSLQICDREGLRWTKWYSLDEKAPEATFTSIILSEEVSWKYYNEIIAPKLNKLFKE
jgi:hypothetical protein